MNHLADQVLKLPVEDALILSNTGGLRETTNHALILNKIHEDIYLIKLSY